MNGHLDLVTSLHLTPSGGELISSSYDSNIKIWNLESGICFKTLNAHTGAVICLQLLPNGRLASGSTDRNILFPNCF